MSTETTCCDAGLCGPNSATHYFVDAPSDIDTQPESILERLRVPSLQTRCAPACAGGHVPSSGETRVFDAAGLSLCEDCIRDIAPVVAQLRAALQAEGE